MTTNHPSPDLPDNSQASAWHLFRILSGMWQMETIRAALALSLPEHLEQGPQTIHHLAQVTNTHPQSLYRLLRALASLRIGQEEQGEDESILARRFAPTPLSTLLCSTTPDSMWGMAQMLLSDWEQTSWRQLVHSVRTGNPAFEQVHGIDLWTYFQQHPEDFSIFNQAMTAISHRINQAVADAYDFTSLRTIVDVGGGQGTLFETLLRAYPHLTGILFDRPEVVCEAELHLQAQQDLSMARWQTVGGSFFEQIPQGGDVYLLKQVLHDWPDEQASQILALLRAAVRDGTRVLIIEHVLPERGAVPYGAFVDLEMLVDTHGQERTEREYRRLLTHNGFALTRVVSTDSPSSILEGVAI